MAQEKALYPQLFEYQLQRVNRHWFATRSSVGDEHTGRGKYLYQGSGGHAADRINTESHRTVSHQPERLLSRAVLVNEHDVASGGFEFFQQFLPADEVDRSQPAYFSDRGQGTADSGVCTVLNHPQSPGLSWVYSDKMRAAVGGLLL